MAAGKNYWKFEFNYKKILNHDKFQNIYLMQGMQSRIRN